MENVPSKASAALVVFFKAQISFWSEHTLFFVANGENIIQYALLSCEGYYFSGVVNLPRLCNHNRNCKSKSFANGQKPFGKGLQETKTLCKWFASDLQVFHKPFASSLLASKPMQTFSKLVC